MNKDKYITKSQLHKQTGAPGYIITYLKDCGRLPIVQESKGRGYPTLYDPSAVEVIKKHISKCKHQQHSL